MKPEELEILIRANHILHHQNVVDAYGHVSLRHPDKPDIFIMSGDRAPALVSSPSHLIEYHISDASPVNPAQKKGYQERFIHSEIYKRYPHINSVIHSHSPAVIPYTMNGVSMKPVFHIAGFLGTHVPTYDILPLYQPGQQQDLLVNTPHFGSVLASKFADKEEGGKGNKHNVVLMSNHGFTVIGNSVTQALYRAVYTHINAGIQTQALMLRSAFAGGGEGGKEGLGEMRFLDNGEVSEGCMKMNDSSQERAWGLWVREVEVNGLYRLEM